MDRKENKERLNELQLKVKWETSEPDKYVGHMHNTIMETILEWKVEEK